MEVKLSLCLAALILASAVPASAQDAGAERLLEVEEGSPFELECPLRVEQRARWSLDGRALPSDARAAETAPEGRLAARLLVDSARAAHAGVYTCGREPAQRVRVRVRPRPQSRSPGTEPAPTEAAAEASAGVALELLYYNVSQPIVLNCSLGATALLGELAWRKNGTAVEELADLKGRYELEEGGSVLRIKARTHQDDFGNYTCGVRGEERSMRGWEVRGLPHAKLAPNANVVEGTKLKLTCRVVGKPFPRVAWRKLNDSEPGAGGVDVRELLGERVALARSEQGVDDAELLLAAAERTDAGVYECAPVAPGAAPAATTLRVKDKYAALWPFLGICAEVLVLCTLILVYERRRTKPELDDSDTDNHDQKKS